MVSGIAKRALEIIAASGCGPSRSPPESPSLVARLSSSAQPSTSGREHGQNGASTARVARETVSGAGFQPPPHVKAYVDRVRRVMDEHVLPAEPELEVSLLWSISSTERLMASDVSEIISVVSAHILLLIFLTPGGIVDM